MRTGEPARGANPDVERRLRQPQADELDTRPDVRVAQLAADRWGVLSLDELRGCGLTRQAVLVRVRNGRLHPLHRGVYAVGHANPPLEGRWLAAVKACGDAAVLSHLSAAALWGIVPWEGGRPEVTVPGPGSRTHPGIRVHRSAHLEWPDRMRHRGIAITSPARTLLDIAAVLDQRSLRRAVRHAQAVRRVSVPQLVAVLVRLRPRRGAVKLARVVATGPAPTRSELEDAVLDLILNGALAHPDVNVPLIVGGRRLIPDFRWPAQHLVVEADGAAWHDDKVAREDDAERQALLEVHGERVIRVTWHQAVTRPNETLARIRAAGAPPAGRGWGTSA
jgi:very-short-patch-repair endonuclease